MNKQLLLRYIFILSLTIPSVRKVYATPTLPDPGTRSTTIFTTINSDYGPRNISPPATNPHLGIDYNITAGNNAYAVEAGNITNISNIGNNFCQLTINNRWRYIHMADSQESFQIYKKGTSVPGSSINKLDRDVIVFRSGSGSSWTTEKVLHISGLTPATFSFCDPKTGQTILTQTTVAQNEWVFVSRYWNRPHLHLDYNSGQGNPLGFVCHQDNLNPIIFPRYKFIDASNIARNFPNDIIYNRNNRPVILQLGIDVTSDKDLNIAEIFIKQLPSGTYQQFNRWEYEPRLANLQIRTSTGNARNIYVLDHVDPDIAQAVAEGVYPAPDLVSFDFFKVYWNTRERISGTGEARTNLEARWPDGRYMVKMAGTDITSHSSPSAENEKIVDNFRPRIGLTA